MIPHYNSPSSPTIQHFHKHHHVISHTRHLFWVHSFSPLFTTGMKAFFLETDAALKRRVHTVQEGLKSWSSYISSVQRNVSEFQDTQTSGPSETVSKPFYQIPRKNMSFSTDEYKKHVNIWFQLSIYFYVKRTLRKWICNQTTTTHNPDQRFGKIFLVTLLLPSLQIAFNETGICLILTLTF